MKDPAERLIVALDVPNVKTARILVSQLRGTVHFYKIGLELLFSGGFEFASELAAEGQRLFIDAKLLDISNTIERATANLADIGATFLTLHGVDQKTMKAAIKGRGDSALKLLAVTVLTHLDQNDLREQGIECSLEELVVKRAKLATSLGIDGVVASPREALVLRENLGPEPLIVTPGIRPKGYSSDDQSRTLTPYEAIRASADYLVIGRPITQATSPQEAACLIIDEMGEALAHI